MGCWLMAVTANVGSWAEHADVTMKVITGLLSVVGILLTTLSVILWGMVNNNKKNIATLFERFDRLPEIYIERHFCISCQKGQDSSDQAVSKLLGIMQERQYRIEESINDLRNMMVEFFRKHE